MKPMSPEDRELEQLRAEVSARYRASVSEEPSASLDAAILDAARREAGRPRSVRNWHVPAAAAAVVVIGVSVALLMRDGVDSLPPLDDSGSRQAQLATPAAPTLEMKATPAPQQKKQLDGQSRPSRERTQRGDRESERLARNDAPAPPQSDSAQPSPSATAPAAVAEATDVSPAPIQESETEVAGAVAKPRALADAAGEARAPSLRKEAPAAAVGSEAYEQAEVRSPEQWARDIESLIRDGRPEAARRQLAELRKRHPGYKVSEVLLVFERQSQSAPE